MKNFIEKIRKLINSDNRFVALLLSGSNARGESDEYSDIDLIIAVNEVYFEDVINNRLEFAKNIDGLICAVTGEQIEDPRALICLYGPNLMRVDMRFISKNSLYEISEKTEILWAKDKAEIETILSKATIEWPNKTPEWFENHTWILLHYTITKLKRGELMEAMGTLAFLREQILGPMIYRHLGENQRGVRKIELLETSFKHKIAKTVAEYDAESIKKAIKNSISLYLELRNDETPEVLSPLMPDALLELLEK